MATAAGSHFSPPLRVLESSADNNQVSNSKDETVENSADLEQIPNRKPPRHLSVVRHTINSPAGAVNLVSKTSHESLTCM